MAKKPQAKAAAASAHEASAHEAAPTSKLVRMVRDASAFPAPHSADVHPDEVENFRAGGWQEG
jgi:hypothetical protein